MENLTETMSKTGLHTNNVSVDGEMIENLLKMMQNNNISSLSVPELLEQLATMKMNKGGGSSASTDGPTTPLGSQKAETTFPMGSPDFSFKSPSNVFTPFKMSDKTNTKKKTTKINDTNGQVFNVDSGTDSDDQSAKQGPFSGTSNRPMQSQAASAPLGSFYSMARESIPSNVNDSRPSTSEGGLFANAALNSLGGTAPPSQAPALNGVQFHIGNPVSKSSKSSSKAGASRGVSSNSAAPKAPGDAFVFNPSSIPHTSTSDKEVSNGFSLFWGDKPPAASTTPAAPGPFSGATARASGGAGAPFSAAGTAIAAASGAGGPSLFANTSVNVMNSSNTVNNNTGSAKNTSTSGSSMGGLPLYSADEPKSRPTAFTFTIGVDGSTSRHKATKVGIGKTASATSSATAANAASKEMGKQTGYTLGSGDLLSSSSKSAAAAPASQSQPFSHSVSGTSFRGGGFGSESAESREGGRLPGVEPSFTVYTLGDNDILHSLNDFSSEEDEDTASESGLEKRNKGTSATYKAQEGKDFEFVFEDDEGEMSLDEGTDEDGATTARDSASDAAAGIPKSKGASVHPFSSSSTGVASGISASATAPQSFLFNGQSASASMFQFEKENLNMFEFPQSNLNGVKFNVGSSGNQTTSSSRSSSNSGTGRHKDFATTSTAAGAPGGLSGFDPQATYDRVSQAFAGLSVNSSTANTTTATASSSSATGSTAAAASAATTSAGPSRASPVLPPFAATSASSGGVPTSAGACTGAESSGSQGLGVEGLGLGLGAATFNIGKSVPSAQAPSASAGVSTRSRSAKKLSPSKRKPVVAGTGVGSSTSSKGPHGGGVDSGAAVDQPPLWWTQAQTAAAAAAGGVKPGMQFSSCSHEFVHLICANRTVFQLWECLVFFIIFFLLFLCVVLLRFRRLAYARRPSLGHKLRG